jgi:hypothetical protein
MKEYRLHRSRITAIKVLHTAGVVFTARWVVSACEAVAGLLELGASTQAVVRCLQRQRAVPVAINVVKP